MRHAHTTARRPWHAAATIGWLVLGSVCLPACRSINITISEATFGETGDGEIVKSFTIVNSNGVKAKLITYGALLTELHVPDKTGAHGDVVLGFHDLSSYLKGHPFFGCTTGRFANRIAKGRFTLDGVEYALATNNNTNHLHGGDKGLDKRIWTAEIVASGRYPGIRFRYLSPDGEEGYPGNLDVSVTYTLTDDDEIRIDYTATTDRPTPVNLTHHSYFNLAGALSGRDVLGHRMMVAASHFTPVDAESIPTGEIRPVTASAMDFTDPVAIGARIEEVSGGYDHNYVLDGDIGDLKLAARVEEPESGRVMEVFTTEPGLQIYTGNYLDGSIQGKGGVAYQRHAGLCLEAQHFPDSVNHKNFPSTILRPGETYKQTTVYKFSANND